MILTAVLLACASTAVVLCYLIRRSCPKAIAKRQLKSIYSSIKPKELLLARVLRSAWSNCR